MSRRPNVLGPGPNNLIAALLIAIGLWSIPALAQDPLITLPNNYRSVLDNSAVAVIRAHYGPHEKIPVHDHSGFSTVFVYLSDSGQVRIDHAEAGGKATSVIRPPTVKGSFRVIAGQAERHSIENLGDTSSDFLRVELKQVPLELKDSFRGKAPQNLSQNQDSVEFTDPVLQIERIICEGSSQCPVKPSSAPSLIIAFTPLSMATGASEKREKLDGGEVRWLPSSQAATITPDAASPAHILRILLPTARK
jgi:hypothetical protein